MTRRGEVRPRQCAISASAQRQLKLTVMAADLCRRQLDLEKRDTVADQQRDSVAPADSPFEHRPGQPVDPDIEISVRQLTIAFNQRRPVGIQRGPFPQTADRPSSHPLEALPAAERKPTWSCLLVLHKRPALGPGFQIPDVS